MYNGTSGSQRFGHPVSNNPKMYNGSSGSQGFGHPVMNNPRMYNDTSGSQGFGHPVINKPRMYNDTSGSQGFGHPVMNNPRMFNDSGGSQGFGHPVMKHPRMYNGSSSSQGFGHPVMNDPRMYNDASGSQEFGHPVINKPIMYNDTSGSQGFGHPVSNNRTMFNGSSGSQEFGHSVSNSPRMYNGSSGSQEFGHSVSNSPRMYNGSSSSQEFGHPAGNNPRMYNGSNGSQEFGHPVSNNPTMYNGSSGSQGFGHLVTNNLRIYNDTSGSQGLKNNWRSSDNYGCEGSSVDIVGTDRVVANNIVHSDNITKPIPRVIQGLDSSGRSSKHVEPCCKREVSGNTHSNHICDNSTDLSKERTKNDDYKSPPPAAREKNLYSQVDEINQSLKSPITTSRDKSRSVSRSRERKPSRGPSSNPICDKSTNLSKERTEDDDYKSPPPAAREKNLYSQVDKINQRLRSPITTSRDKSRSLSRSRERKPSRGSSSNPICDKSTNLSKERTKNGDYKSPPPAAREKNLYSQVAKINQRLRSPITRSRDKSRSVSRSRERKPSRGSSSNSICDKSTNLSKERTKNDDYKSSPPTARENNLYSQVDKINQRLRSPITTSRDKSRSVSRSRERKPSRGSSSNPICDKSTDLSKERTKNGDYKSPSPSARKNSYSQVNKINETVRSRITLSRDKSRSVSRSRERKRSRGSSRNPICEKSTDLSKERTKSGKYKSPPPTARKNSYLHVNKINETVRSRITMSREKSRSVSHSRERTPLRESRRDIVDKKHNINYRRRSPSSNYRSRHSSRGRRSKSPISKSRYSQRPPSDNERGTSAHSRFSFGRRSYQSRPKSDENASTDKKAYNIEKLIEKEKKVWTRVCPNELFYQPEEGGSNNVVYGTKALEDNLNKFEQLLVQKARDIRANHPRYQSLPRKPKEIWKKSGGCHSKSDGSSSSSSSSSSDEMDTDFEDHTSEELQHKINHPLRLHSELWFNDSGEMNDGPLCRCSAKSQRSGIRHNIYAGESHLHPCNPNSNNAHRLHHYRVTISPTTNFVVQTPTIIDYDNHEYIFEGFSMFSHKKLKKLPQCKVIRFNIEYTILYYDEKFPPNFTVKELDLFNEYLFKELLELVDLDFKAHNDPDGCPQYHFMPRFVRELEGNGKELLSMNEVIKYLISSYKPLVREEDLEDISLMSLSEWQEITEEVKGMIVTNPGKRPASIRVDQLDRDKPDENETSGIESDGNESSCSSTTSKQTYQSSSLEKTQSSRNDESSMRSSPSHSSVSSKVRSRFKVKRPKLRPMLSYPEIVHFGIRPTQLSYAGNPEYQKAWRQFVKFRHLVANMSKPTFEDKRKLESKENQLQNMRIKNELKRNVTVTVSSKGFYMTGIMCDVVQHAMLIPVLVAHLRFHCSLDTLEERIDYLFENRFLLQLALTHPSYRENFGTNPDHGRNSLSNCGIRQPVYGDRKIHYMNTRKRGINTLINIMSRFGKLEETESKITHNERLEFLGDAVVEFVSSIHIFFLFPGVEEGGLATYRAAIVQNQQLAVMAKKLGLEEFMLYAHGSDLCHDLELRHAMANCFEALMGALFLDGGIDVADKVFGNTLYKGEKIVADVWFDLPLHPLQEQEPQGDRKWIEDVGILQELTKFEESIGVEFKHIRLLARAFTDRSVGVSNLTLGSNQRLEFLGDTVLQLIASEYLYKFYPEHHEGHLSLLRSSLVNNRTQAVVCDDLGMTMYARYANPKAELKTKDRADLLEALLGALYVDQGLEDCQEFCKVCFFPRLEDFIKYQDWNDPKSKLQQCCLTLRTMEGGEPEIPLYKVVNTKGPTNTREYEVAVYFKGDRLSCAIGGSIQSAEMNAAKAALNRCRALFPQLKHQKRVISKSLQTPPKEEAVGPSLEKIKEEWISEADQNVYYKKVVIKREVMKNDETLAESEKVLPLSYQSCNVIEPSVGHLSSSDTTDCDKLEELSKKDVSKHQSSKVSKRTCKPKYLTKNKINEELAPQKRKRVLDKNDGKNSRSGSPLKKIPKKDLECNRIIECKEKPVLHDKRIKLQRYSSQDIIYDQQKLDRSESKSRESSAKGSLRYSSMRYQSTSSLDYSVEKDDRIQSRNTRKRGCESHSPHDSFRGENSNSRSRSTSRARSLKQRSHYEVERAVSPTPSMGRQKRSKSREDIKQTLYDIMYGDKKTIDIKKETVSSSLTDFMFNKGNKGKVLEFGNASSSSIPSFHQTPDTYPAFVPGDPFSEQREKQENVAQEIVENNLYQQPQCQGFQPYLPNYQPNQSSSHVNIKKEHVKHDVSYETNFHPTNSLSPQYCYEYEDTHTYNYNMQ